MQLFPRVQSSFPGIIVKFVSKIGIGNIYLSQTTQMSTLPDILGAVPVYCTIGHIYNCKLTNVWPAQLVQNRLAYCTTYLGYKDKVYNVRPFQSGRPFDSLIVLLISDEISFTPMPNPSNPFETLARS